MANGALLGGLHERGLAGWWGKSYELISLPHASWDLKFQNTGWGMLAQSPGRTNEPEPGWEGNHNMADPTTTGGRRLPSWI